MAHQLFHYLRLAVALLTVATTQAEPDDLAAIESLGSPEILAAVPTALADDTSNAPAEMPAAGECRPLFLDGLPYRSRPTRVFAWYGLPAGASETAPVPSVVLVHGGGGTAYREWVERWLDHGYAALAIDTEGQANADGALAGARHRHGQAGPARAGIFGDRAEPVRDQWMFHAVGTTVRANSWLRAQPAVRSTAVGVAGISWGGVVASTAIGLDRRWSFGVIIYASGGLHRIPNQYGRALRGYETYRLAWDATLRLPRAALPTLWLSWPGETHSPLDAQAASYHAVGGPFLVSVVPDLGHGHRPGWSTADTFAFADSVFSSGRPWASQLSAMNDGGAVRVVFRSAKPLDSAELWLARRAQNEGARAWDSQPARLAAQPDGTWAVKVALPADDSAWFVNVYAAGLTVSSALQTAKN